MKHKLVSFFGPELPPEISYLQKEVFKKFNLELEQIELINTSSFHTHSDTIEKYLNENLDWELISIFDVDCIPTSDKCITLAYDIIKDGNTLYGNAQASNVFVHDIYKSPPYIGASFINFSKQIWEESNHKSFSAGPYPNPEGNLAQADVGEQFVRENEKQGRKIVLKYPTNHLTEPLWYFKGYYNYPEFAYGIGTEFESFTYHNFAVRIPEHQKYFIKYCEQILKS